MSENNKRPKLKSNRFNKFEKFDSRPSTTASTSPVIPRQPHKRICIETQVSSNSKRMCHGLMHPPTNTVNLANSRLQKLKQKLQDDLKEKRIKPTVCTDTKTEKSSINDSLEISNDPDSPIGSCKSIYKNLSKWASPENGTTNVNNANQRLKRLKQVMNETILDNGTPNVDSSGPTRFKSAPVLLPEQHSKSMQNANLLSTMAPLSRIPKLSSHCSPLLREDKMPCKRKISQLPPDLDEQISTKIFLPDPHIPQTSSEIRIPPADTVITVNSVNKIMNSATQFSARILKIKQKTEQLNCSLNSSSSPASENVDTTFNEDGSGASLEINISKISETNVNKLDQRRVSNSSTPISQRLKISRKHSHPNNKFSQVDSHTRESQLDTNVCKKSHLIITSSPVSQQIRLDRRRIRSKKTLKQSPISKQTDQYCNENRNKSPSNNSLSQLLKPTSESSLSHQLKLNKERIFQNTSKHKTRLSMQRYLPSFSNSSKLNLNVSQISSPSPQPILDKLKSRNETSSSVRLSSEGFPISIDTVKNRNSSDLKLPIITQESLSALKDPLPNESDNFEEKMAMTASWIRNHQQFNKNGNTVKNVDNTVMSNNTIVANDCEEMEWSNAEPDVEPGVQIPTEVQKGNKTEATQTALDETIPAEKDKHLCIVVDTNIFISDLSKITDILNLKVTGPIQPLIYIPWMVITELDEMKDRPGSNSLKFKVMNALKLINKLLSEDNPKVKGQTVYDMGKQIHVGSSQDDKIIGTCLQATEKYENVILLSNDINLKNKAMINNITASSPHEIIMKIMLKLVKNTKYQKIMQKMSLLCSSIICECTKEAYGDVWSKMDMLSSPPWSLAECMKRFQKYWIAVFQDKLMKQFLVTVDKLQRLLITNEYFSDDSDKYKEFLKLNLDLCIFLKDIEDYRATIGNTINDIVKL